MIAIIVWLSFDGTFRGAVGERRRGDRDSVIAETSCCRISTILAPDQAVGISHRVMAVVVQGASQVSKLSSRTCRGVYKRPGSSGSTPQSVSLTVT
jgi:hypothetical protein